MKPMTARRGPFYSLLFLAVVVALMVCWALVGPAQGASPTTSIPADDTQETSFTVNASELGYFATEPPLIESPSAIVINMSTGRVLYEHNSYKQRPMASTTKIMTCILILERMDLDTEVIVSAGAAATSETIPFLKEGDILTVDQLVHVLVVRSANSASVALAEACSGSVKAFVAEMNEKAESLGLDDTHYVHPSGLDREGHYSTAADLAVLARYAMQNEKFRELVSTKEYTLVIPGRNKTVECTNTNKLLGKLEWVTGIKTGLTPKAEQCLVASGTRDGVNIISVLLGQPVPDICWAESEVLLEYGFTQCKYVTLVENGEVVAEASVPYQLDGRLQLVTAEAVSLELYKDDSATASIEVERQLTLPVSEGDVFGQVTVTVEERVVDTIDLVAAQSYDTTSLGSKIVYFWRRLGRVLGRVF